MINSSETDYKINGAVVVYRPGTLALLTIFPACSIELVDVANLTRAPPEQRAAG
jgi:hypothetical protein